MQRCGKVFIEIKVVQIFGKSSVLHHPFPVDNPTYWLFPSHPHCAVSEEAKEHWISTDHYSYDVWNLLEEKKKLAHHEALPLAGS